MNSEGKPTISVIMGIYNCAETLPEAIESVLCQTYEDWELIMCDDGSTDNTYEIARKYQNKFTSKIVLIQNEKNCGLNYTLNRCLKIARGDFIARMDGDDRCAPDRFIEEMDVFKAEPDISIVSTDMAYFNGSGIWGEISHPEYPKKIDFLYGTPFCHAPCLVKKEAYTGVGGYSDQKRFLRVEDYHLWIKMYQKGYRGKNIHKQLYYMRDDNNAYNRRKFKYRINEAYVKALAVHELGLPIYGYIYALIPIIIGLLPKPIYDYLHKTKLKRK